MVNPAKPWLKHYPEGVPHEVYITGYNSLLDMFEEAFERYPNRRACEYLDKFLTYRELDQHSKHFASYLQGLGLEPGSRVAIMLPNVLQFQIAMIGILRAGFVVVNVNPLYTARELEHQLKDSGASVLVILENFAHVYQHIAAEVPLKQTIVTSLGEMIGLKGSIVNFVVRNVKKLVPAWDIPGHITFLAALGEGSRQRWNKPNTSLSDIAFFQYTGGTTGLSKGAILLHSNILSNVIQTELWLEPGLKRKQVDQLVFLCALPMYHIFALTACSVLGMRKGGLLVLVPNPRDFDGFIKLLKKHPNINIFPGVHFGGSLFAMTDPFFMMMVSQNLGKGYIIWDQAAKIEFLKPGKGKVHAEFEITQEQLDQIVTAAESGDKVLKDFVVDIKDRENDVVARVTKTLYIRKKQKKN
jgi:long-chain acyl-CoA synthetase